MKINYNISAMIANTQLGISEGKLSSSMEKLSSGFKINHAKDDPSGLAIAKRMNAQIRGLELSESAAKTGISVVQTAEGALNEVHDMLQRMNELAVQSANGTMSDEQRGYIQDEVNALQDEIVRIASDTAFNGQGLMDGSFDYRAYTNNADVKCTYYSDGVDTNEYNLEIQYIYRDGDGNMTGGGVVLGPEFPVDTQLNWADDKLVITASDGFEMNLTINPDLVVVQGDGTDNIYMTIDVTGIGAMRLQVGANEGQVMQIRIPEITLSSMGIDTLDMTTQESARDGIEKITNAVEYISGIRSSLGAYQNRLEYTVANLAGATESLTNAHSLIMDTDMAKEMTNYTTYQVMTQAGTAMLAQANERPQLVLQLLQ